MTSFKGKTKVGLTKATEVRGYRQSCGGSKFKIYSENDKISGGNGGVTFLQTSLPAKNGTQPAKSCSVEDLASNAKNSRDSRDTLEKTKVVRKALADVSNVRGISSKLDKPGGCRAFRKSVPSGALASTASSSQSIMVKFKPDISHGVATSHSTVKDTSKKSVRTSSNFNRVQPQQNAENKPRQISDNSNAFERLYAQRKSYPILKRSSHVHANNSQGRGTSLDKATRKFGFPMKTGAGGTVSSQVRNKNGKALNDRSNIVTVLRNQSSKDVPQKLRKSIKPVVSSSSQVVISRKNSKSNRICSMDEPLVTITSKDTRVTECSIPMPLKSADHEVPGRESPAEDSGKADKSADKRSSRRKSYTFLLVSNSKLLRKKNELVELEKLPNIDDQDNPLEVAEYVDDIYQYYWVMESAPLENCMMIQTDITPQIRGILINWLIEVHFKFDLMPETLYLTVALLDRYLSLVPINKKEMQLVGLTSLLLASKYEDFWHPRVKDLISISSESYTRTQMLDTEKVILRKLKFRLNLPTAYVFMLRFLKASQSDEQLEHLAFYLIELCLVDYESLKFRPSHLCASAVYVARCTLNKVPAWTPLLSKHARYEESQIRECADMICRLHKAAKTGLLKVTYEKYKRPEFGGVATIKALHTLPL